MAKSKIGDIVEIPTERGLAYAHHTHRHAMYGSLLRVFTGFDAERPVDILSVADRPVQFSTFFPLNAAVTRKIVQIAAHRPVDCSLAPFPTFRAGVVDPGTGVVGTWYLWDGENEWRVGALTEDQRQFPVRGVMNDTALIERIVDEWNPAVEVR
jgi:hypothetical protein